MVTCEADRRWSMVNAYCLAFCHSPIQHPNAYPTSRSCQMAKAHQAGSRCKFRCKKGYHIEGMPAKRYVILIFFRDVDSRRNFTMALCRSLVFTKFINVLFFFYWSDKCIIQAVGNLQKILLFVVWNSRRKYSGLNRFERLSRAFGLRRVKL